MLQGHFMGSLGLRESWALALSLMEIVKLLGKVDDYVIGLEQGSSWIFRSQASCCSMA
jgi:hypothetical protein